MEPTEHPDFEENSNVRTASLAQAIHLSREVEDLMLFVDSNAPVNNKVERLCYMYRKVSAAPDFPAGPGFDDKQTLLGMIGQMVRRLDGNCR